MTDLQQQPDFDALRALGQRIRVHALRMTHKARSSHIGGLFSEADLLAVLYTGILRVDPADPDFADRDRFILSKGHACAAVYAVLAERGFFPLSWLETFYGEETHLAGHISHSGVPGVEASTGALGHGLPIATGMALAAHLDARPYRVFALLSDGECDEGSTWEAALFAGHHKLVNLTVIVDYNKIQSLGRVEEVLDLEPFASKWRDFGWSVREINGHDVSEIHQALAAVPWEPDRPSCLIAHTVKGKGVSFMENDLLWHYRSANDDELARALVELGAVQ
jgi:transketolase